MIGKPDPQVISERVRLLREYRWSSYRGYAGYCAPLPWVCVEPLGQLCGGRTQAEQRAGLRQYTEQAVRQGVIESPWEQLVAGVVLGSEAFARRLRQELHGNRREQTALKRLDTAVSWQQIVSAVEQSKGEPWEAFHSRYGDEGRDAALWLGRHRGRLSLAQLGALAGNLDYAAVGQAVSRFGKRLEKEAELRKQLGRIEARMSNVEM